MATFKLRISLPGSSQQHYRKLNKLLQQESGKRFKKVIAFKQASQENAEYNIETSIEITELAGYLSGISTKINKHSSFTLLRNNS